MANPPAGLDEFISQPDAAPAQPVDSGAAPTASLPAAPAGLDQFIAPELKDAQYSTPGQQLLTGAENLGHGLAGPLATWAEKGLSNLGVPGLTPEDQEARAHANPEIAGTSEVAGLVGPAVVSLGTSAMVRAELEAPEVISAGAKALEKYSQTGLLGKLGTGAAELTGLGGEGASALSRIGSHVVSGAVETGLFQAGDELSKAINGDPEAFTQSALSHVGLATLLGAGIGGGIGSVSTLWRSRVGSQVGELLDSIANRVGGTEGQAGTTGLVSRSGMEVEPELHAVMQGDPEAQRLANHLNQSDTTKTGRQFQETVKEFHQDAGETLSQSLGKNPDSIPDAFDQYNHGKNIGKTLAEEFQEQLDPSIKDLEETQSKYKNEPLAPSIEQKAEAAQQAIVRAEKDLEKLTKKAVKAQTLGDPEEAIQAAAKVQDAQGVLTTLSNAAKAPGTTDVLSDKIAGIVEREKWGISPKSDIMKMVRQIQEELPGLKTVDDLSAYIKTITANFQKDPFNGALNRAAGLIKSELRGAEGELIGAHVGSEEGAEALDKYRKAQAAFAERAKVKDALDSVLHVKGSVSGFSKNLKTMSQEDGEAIWRKLSGKKDAATLHLLQEQFPRTAQAIREAHLDEILSKAKVGDHVDPYKVIKALEGLSPQMRSFLTPGGMSDRIEAIAGMLQKFKEMPHNYSNTARTMDALLQNIPGSAVGLVSMLLGHNPVIGLALGKLTQMVSKDAPDAVRLALLKWMGSSKPIEAGAFKSMVEYIQAAKKGESLINNAAESVFKDGAKVLPEHMIPSEQDIRTLDKKLVALQTNPNGLEDVGQHAGYYLPNHGIAMGATSQNAVSYLNSIRPSEVKLSPLDAPIKPSEAQQAEFDRALTIAQQPLTVMNLLKQGRLTATDAAHLKALYPAFYQKQVQKLTDQMVSHVSDGKSVPYEMRAGLSMLMGQPLDSSLTELAIQTNQAAYLGAAQQAAGMNSAPKKTSKSGMQKLGNANRYSLEIDDNGE